MAQDLVYEIELRLDEAEKKLNGLNSKVENDAKDSGKKAGVNYGNAMASAVGAIVSAISFAKILDGSKDFIATSLKVEEQMADVAKTTGIAGEALAEMRQELFAMGRDSRTPNEELRKIAESVGRLGIQGKTDILAFTKVVDTLNVALGDEFAGGAEQITAELGVLSKVLKGIPAEEPAERLLRVGNALNVLGAETAASAPVISDFAGRIGGLAPKLQAGNILGLSAALQELGVNAERGGTAVGTIINRMGVLLTNKDEAGELAKAMGMTADEVTRLFNDNPNEAFLVLSEKIGGANLTSVELAETLDGLGLAGAGASEVIQKVGANTDLVRTNQEKANKALENATSIQEEYNIKNETSQATLEKFKNRIEEVKTGLGDALAPTFTIALNALTPFLEKLIGFVTENPGVTSNLILLAGAFSGIATVVLAVMSAFSFLAPILSSIVGLFGGATAGAGMAGTLTALTGPIGWVILAVGSLIALATLIYQNWEQVVLLYNTYLVPILKALGDIIGDVLAPAITTLTDTFNNQLMPALMAFWSFISPIVLPILAALVEVLGGVLVIAIGVLVAAFWLILQVVNFVMLSITSVITNTGRIIAGFVEIVKGVFEGDWERAWEGFKMVSKSAIDFIMTPINALLGAIRDIIDQANKLTGIGDKIGALGSNIGSLRSKLGFATGGKVFGAGTATSDSIDAMLSKGEYVINAKSTAMFEPLLEALNNMGNTTNNATTNNYGVNFGGGFSNPNFLLT